MSYFNALKLKSARPLDFYGAHKNHPFVYKQIHRLNVTSVYTGVRSDLEGLDDYTTMFLKVFSRLPRIDTKIVKLRFCWKISRWISTKQLEFRREMGTFRREKITRTVSIRPNWRTGAKNRVVGPHSAEFASGGSMCSLLRDGRLKIAYDEPR